MPILQRNKDWEVILRKKQFSPGKTRNPSNEIILDAMTDDSNSKGNSLESSFMVHNVLNLRNEIPTKNPGIPTSNISRRTPEKRNRNTMVISFNFKLLQKSRISLNEFK